MSANEEYSTIREILGEFIGTKIIEITQHDQEYFQRTGRSFVDLMLDSGDVLRFYVEDQGLCVNPTDESEEERFGNTAEN